ncbi:hypothetical protein DFH06DRAFT_687590 [Mycena polygramma]|nr:hypothetical protein DFH06DRAFT_687590 [Mycena polygramma]
MAHIVRAIILNSDIAFTSALGTLNIIPAIRFTFNGPGPKRVSPTVTKASKLLPHFLALPTAKCSFITEIACCAPSLLPLDSHPVYEDMTDASNVQQILGCPPGRCLKIDSTLTTSPGPVLIPCLNPIQVRASRARTSNTTTYIRPAKVHAVEIQDQFLAIRHIHKINHYILVGKKATTKLRGSEGHHKTK